MSASVLYMSMSLDGYIAGPNDDPRNPGGDGLDRCAQASLTDRGRKGIMKAEHAIWMCSHSG